MFNWACTYEGHNPWHTVWKWKIIIFLNEIFLFILQKGVRTKTNKFVTCAGDKSVCFRAISNCLLSCYFKIYCFADRKQFLETLFSRFKDQGKRNGKVDGSQRRVKKKER